MEHATVCLCMITKDEETFLKKCIDSVREIVDEIVIVDTGSTDGTVALAKELGAKVYAYAWQDSFALARNYAMSKAQSEWLLLLDADEALEQQDHKALIDFINTTTLDGAHLRVRNYTGKYAPDQYSMHNALRLLRNNGQYRYHGAIHEQISFEGGADVSSRFTVLEVTVHHFGYLDDVVKRKDKRGRNMPLLEKQLALDPDEPFTLFNMGNEYLSLKDYQKALAYYEEALTKLNNRRIAFAPHLFLRMVNCCSALGQQERALRLIQEGILTYPRCTDFVFVRADIYKNLGRFTLAIDSLEACLSMGAPPPTLELLPGCGTYRAAFALGELYLELNDYARAAKYYTQALSFKSQLYTALYRLGKAFRYLYPGGKEVKEKLFAFFADPAYTPNALVGADVLAMEGYYEEALSAIATIDPDGHAEEIAYLRGKALLFLDMHEQARPLLKSAAMVPEGNGRVLRGVPAAGGRLLLALHLMEEEERGQQEDAPEEALSVIEVCGDPHAIGAAKLMLAVFRGERPEDPKFENGGEAELTWFMEVLDCMLKAKAFSCFDRLLPSLNYVDAKHVLLRLASVFEENGYPALAKEHVLRNIRELDHIDAAGAGILYRTVR